ncbi:MAG: NADH-quinone oxidoreductase subunit C [Gemmatimonadota bacterium]|nr:NADH-quinone oxidoreductase subunit C [Gemmatimonadota bacterium]
MEKTNENKTLEALKNRFGQAIIECGLDRQDPVAVVEPGKIHDIISFLKDDQASGYKMLIDLFGVDYSPRKPRFEVVYILHNPETHDRLRLRVRLEETGCEVASIHDLYPVADWLERETWDMFGIRFSGHPNLKRILTYGSFEGHPLRRDYPIDKRQPLIGPQN